MTDPSGGVTRYAYDAGSRLTSITYPSGAAVTFQYDSLSRRTQMTRPGNAVTNYSYDADGRLTSLTHQSAAGSLSFSYTFDRAGNRLSATDNAGTHSYIYDTLYQLTSAAHPAGQQPSESYTYDAGNNRTASHLSGTYSYNAANRLTADSQFDYAYDANGNLTTKTERATGKVTSYSYDSENQLTRIDLPAGASVTYKYDGLGRRIEKNVSGTVTRYVYDGQNVLAEYAADGSVTARYMHGPEIDELLAVAHGSTLSLVDADATGSVRRIVTGASVSASYDYDSFGRIVAQTGSALSSYYFQGREFDQESGLYYYRARYYDPQVGRFITEDPIGFSGSTNFYQFVGNNPVNALDPLGLKVGFWEGLIPIWGSGKRAIEDFQCGRWGWGLFNTALAVSDVFLLKALATALAKGAVEAGGSLVARETSQVLINRAAGQAAERMVGEQLVAEGNTILGSQVAVRTSEGIRYIDHLIQTPTGEIIAVEVKSGGAVRSASQMAKDAALSTEGGVLTGGGLPAGFSKGDRLIVNTIERRVP
jgi:RHS repeat-associated protein